VRHKCDSNSKAIKSSIKFHNLNCRNRQGDQYRENSNVAVIVFYTDDILVGLGFTLEFNVRTTAPIYNIKNWISSNPSYHNVTHPSGGDEAYGDEEIATFVYSPNFRIAQSVVGEYVKTGTMEPNCNDALHVYAFEGQLNSVPNWEFKTLYVLMKY